MTSGAARAWCVVFGCCTLHMELAAGVFSVAHVHGPQAEDVDLVKVAGRQLLKPVLILSPPCFAQFSSTFILH